MPGRRELLLLLFLLPACAVNTHQDQSLPSSDTVQATLVQSRLIHSVDQSSITTAVSTVLEEMGFKLESAASNSGQLSASRNSEQNAPSILEGLAVLGFYVLTHSTSAPPWSSSSRDAKETITAAVEIAPEASVTGCHIRLLFHRVAYDHEEKISRKEVINEREMYDRFYRLLQSRLDQKIEQIKLPG